MPRKHKREASKKRRARQRATTAQFRTRSSDANHLRIDLDAMEFACVFTIEGGRKEHIDSDTLHRAIDRHGRRVGRAVAPNVLQIGRDKASKLMAKARDAVFLAQLRQGTREDRRSKNQANALAKAENAHSTTWIRQDVPDLHMRSILVVDGEHDGQRLVCFRSDKPEHAGRYVVAAEAWDGDWSASDENAARANVALDFFEGPDGITTFCSPREAQRETRFALAMGEIERREGRFTVVEGDEEKPSQLDAEYLTRFASRLEGWQRRDHGDMKKLFPREAATETVRKPKKPKGKRVRITNQQAAQIAE